MLCLYSKMMMYTIMFASTMMAISSTNMLMIWTSFELNMFSFTPLLLNKANSNEVEASINYFLSQALGSMLFLMTTTMITKSSLYQEPMPNMLIINMMLKLGTAHVTFDTH